MKQIFKTSAVFSVLLTLLFAALYIIKDIFLAAAITFGTISYHLCIRLLIGCVYDQLLANKANYRRNWYRLRSWEKKLYKALRVKRWKTKMPAYDKTLFDLRLHSLDEIAGAMCQAELVHETAILFSFVPLLFSVWFGELGIFAATSVIAAALDLPFAIVQRYNRDRIIHIIETRYTIL